MVVRRRAGFPARGRAISPPVMTFAEFRELARDGGLVPVWRDILLDTDTPVTAFAKLREGPFAFLLESAPAGGETWARYTFMGTHAARGVAAARTAWSRTGRRPRAGTTAARPRIRSPISTRLVHAARRSTCPSSASSGAARSATSATTSCALIERLPSRRRAALRVPDALFVFTDALVIIDNLRAQARVVVGAPSRAPT